MTALTFSSSSLLLVNPRQTQWFSGRGEAMDPPDSPPSRVSVVADLVEESHICISVPGIVGRDRQSFIEGRYQAMLPDVALRGAWQKASAQPLLPKPFELHAMGVSSPALIAQLDELTRAGHPIDGVWSLSYLMAHWATRQASLSGQPWVMLCLGLSYGMRMVLLHKQVPVFSRLLLSADPGAQAQEVGQTLKYLADNRVLERDVRPAIVAMDPVPEFLQGLQSQGLKLLPEAVPRHAGGMLTEVLTLAGSRAPGNLANLELRRHHLAQRTRQGLRLLTGVVVLAGGAGLLMQGRALQAGTEESRQHQQQAAEMTQAAQAIRDDLARRNINVPLLRLALQVQQQELQSGIDPVQQLWQLGQLMTGNPQAQLVRSEQALREQACSDLHASAEAAAAGTESSGLQVEWQFDVRPGADLSPRQRQALLEGLVKTVAAWPQWLVKTNPERQESASALTGGKGSPIDRATTEWRWCLVPRTNLPEVTP
ncbi:hypothetical protein [Aquabacterium sp. UBA2148]|uniref:hypothetical protein n=1 Tax=Aquabacterium sp. UBA2148 TaxID=1946042 RepID=UPI0025808163|nr:hypothetical protein [Aquabacterium sp. UBA2148]